MSEARRTSLLRRHAAFRRFWLSRAISHVGDGIALVALVLHVQETSGSGTAVAGLLLAVALPSLLGPVAGSIADRVDRRRMMIVCELGQGVVYLAITPGLRADAAAALERGPAAFVAEQRERMETVEAGFLWYKLVESATAATGLGLGIAGAVTRDDVLLGVGAGLGVAAMAQLTMENIVHETACRYLGALDGFTVEPQGAGLAARLRF